MNGLRVNYKIIFWPDSLNHGLDYQGDDFSEPVETGKRSASLAVSFDSRLCF